MQAVAERAPAAEEKPVAKEENLAPRIERETLEVLVKAGLLREDERAGFEHYLKSTRSEPGKLLPLMADLRKIEEGEKSATVEKWARSMGPVLKKRHPLVPFASRLLIPASVYEKYPVVEQWAGQARCPIVYAEDTDVFGFGVINPVAGAVLAEKVAAYFREETGVEPYVSLFLLPLDSWNFLSERQFGA